MDININNLIKSAIASTRSTMAYIILGHFGDRLPKDVQDEIRVMAEKEEANSKKITEKVKKNL